MAFKATQFNLQYNKGKDSARVEAFYGPWESVEEFVTSEPGKQAIKCEDVITIAVWDEDYEIVTEYWNPDGSAEFVVKSSSVDFDELDKRYVRVEELGESSEDEESALATKDYVDAKVAELVDGAPETLDTLKEIGEALSNHATAADAILASVAQKANKIDVDMQLADIAKGNVKYTDISDAKNPNRSTIQLKNHDSISGCGKTVDENGNPTEAFNLVMLSKWDVADFGSQHVHMNLNSKDTITINDVEAIATENFVNDAIDAIEIPSVEGLASEAYVETKIAELVGNAPETLDTLKEIADAIDEHNDAYDSLIEVVGSKVSATELAEIIGTPRVEAEGTKGEEDYKPVVPATGLHADIEAVAYRRFMQMIGLVGAADEEVMKNVKDVEHNLHGNIKEVQANLYGNIRGVRNEISDMIRKYLNQEGSDYVLAHDAYELQNMISADDDKKVVVMKDTVLSKTISVGNGVDKVLDLNGCIISNERLDYTTTEDGHTVTSNVDAITVKTGGKLTLVGNGYVTTIAGTASPLYANGGEIVVNGGVYESLQGLDAGGGYSLVYADKTGKVEINDGYFIVNGNPDEKKYQYILNASDPATEAVITVKGGYFYNWDPSTHDNNGHQEVVIPEDYEVEVIENGTFYQHVGTWYHVVKKQNA